MKRLFLAYAALLVIGTAWGSSMPLVKIAVEGGHRPTGIMAIQLTLTVLIVGSFVGLSGRWRNIPLDGAHLRLYGVVGMIGMAIPNLASLIGTSRLPAGVMAIVMSLGALFMLPLSLLLGLETFRARRMIGVMLGAMAVVLLIAPASSLPEPGQWVWVLVGAIAPLSYAMEGMYVSQSTSQQAGPFVILWMASILALALALPLALVTDGFVWPADGLGVPELAIAGSGLVSIVAYAGYIALLRQTGPVFGAQVAYIVTGMGVIWAMLLLGERYSNWVWAALGLLFVGLFLVQPRRNPLEDLNQEPAEHGD